MVICKYTAGVPAKRGGASAPYKRFAAGKTLAQGEFISPGHIKSKGVPARREPGGEEVEW